MTEFVSEIKQVPYGEQAVFEVLSDLNNLSKIRDSIPKQTDMVKDFEFDSDSCSFSVDPVGKVRFSIVEREPYKTIKFTADKTPIGVNFWIQLKEAAPDVTKIKLTIRAELNPFIKPMVSKPLQEGVNRIADILSNIPYGELKK
ncbi:MAG: SRPBCC family protein [Dysgonamonadaceae bacterium]|nr:SRPBCC family protein [Dysgonamonadaceae bacterium]